MPETIAPLPRTTLDEIKDGIARDIKAEMERQIFDAFCVPAAVLSSNVPAPETEPLTFEKLEKIVDSLKPYKASPFDTRWITRIPLLSEMEPLPDRPIRWPVWYGLPLINPRFVIHVDVDPPRWLQVACLARGGRKRRRKVMRRIWV